MSRKVLRTHLDDEDLSSGPLGLRPLRVALAHHIPQSELQRQHFFLLLAHQGLVLIAALLQALGRCNELAQSLLSSALRCLGGGDALRCLPLSLCCSESLGVEASLQRPKRLLELGHLPRCVIHLLQTRKERRMQEAEREVRSERSGNAVIRDRRIHARAANLLSSVPDRAGLVLARAVQLGELPQALRGLVQLVPQRAVILLVADVG